MNLEPLQLVGAALTAGGLVLVGASFWDMVKWAASREWRRDRGRLLEKVIVADGEGYRPEIIVEYSDGVLLHKLQAPAPGTSAGSRDEALQALDRIPRGQEFTVFLNPENPEEACLEPGIRVGAWVGVVIGLVVVAFGLYFLGVSWPDAKSAA